MLYEGINVDTDQKSQAKTVAAPIGGLNGRDALASMAEKDAYEMDNVMPGTTSCKVRQGVEVFHDTLGHPVYSLDVFSKGYDQDKIIATGGGFAKHVTATSVTTLKSDIAGKETVCTMFSTVADNAQWLITTTDGGDIPYSYDGAVMADLAFTGLNEPAENLNYVCQYMGRLFWGTEGKMGFYYLAPGAIQGAMEWYDLGQLTKRGGYLVGMATYSEDAGDGPDDYIVFISSNGEYLMFHGLDPGDATSWEIVGRYRSAPPVGRKCLLAYAGDLIVLTLEGGLQFSQIRKLADTRFEVNALTSKLGDILSKHNIYRATYGWNMTLYSRGGWLMVSVPDAANETGIYRHFVMNTTTQAWTRFWSKEMNGLCWCVANNNIYFGRYDGTIRQADVGNNDNGKTIDWNVKQAYNYCDTMQYKHFKWAQFLLKSEAPAAVSANLSVDYKETKPSGFVSNLDPVPGGIWDVAFWDSDYWAIGPYTQRFIQPFGVYGVAASWWLSGALIGATLEWFATEIVFEKAQGLLG